MDKNYSLDRLFDAILTLKTKDECAEFAKDKAKELLSSSVYTVPEEDGAASYAAKSLIDEAGVVAQAVSDPAQEGAARCDSCSLHYRSSIG